MSGSLRLLGIALVLAALGLLYPGITEPVLTLQGELEKSELAELGVDMLAGGDDSGRARSMLESLSRMFGLDRAEGRVLAYRETRSILSMAGELAENDNRVVAVLILTFSVIIPLTKLLLQFIAFLSPGRIARPLLTFNSAVSKWSMADVFVMAMLVAFMAGRASGHMGELLIMDARLEVGFWYFLGYCLFAIAAGAILRWLASREAELTGS